MANFKPMLADNKKCDVTKLKYPVLVTKKIDGIRGVIINNQILTRSLKALRNRHIQEIVCKYLPNGLDFEITGTSGDFYDYSGSIMSFEGKPNFKIWVFDCFNNPTDAYENRIKEALKLIPESLPFELEVLTPQLINSKEELEAYFESCLVDGFEGVMIRKIGGHYKYGRSTTKEALLLKLKPFEDAEAVILGIEDQLENTNESFKNELGYSVRSSSTLGLVPKSTLGAFIVKDLKSGVEFRIGTGKGLDDSLRKELWNVRETLTGKIIKYQYLNYGALDKPRLPTFLGFRDVADMSN